MRVCAVMPLVLAVWAPCAVAQDADSIIARALARGREIRARMQDARYEADIKFVARDLDLSPDSVASILLISETRSSAYWERSGGYLEAIRACRLSSQGGAGGLASIGAIANVDRDRIEVQEFTAGARTCGEARARSSGGRNRARAIRYSIPSPIADDAMRHYDFELLDTAVVDGRRAYRLAIVPRTDATALLVGVIDIADSTWDVLVIDAGVNRAVHFGFVENLRYAARYTDVGDGMWLPTEIRLTGEVRPSASVERVPRQVAGFRVPGVPRHLRFEHVVVVDSFRFNEGNRPADVGEYRVVMGNEVDDPDRPAWATATSVPMTDAERWSLARADSAERYPGTFSRIAAGVGKVGQVINNPGFFHYNRVDGAYVGVAGDWRVGPAWLLTTRLGYAFGSDVQQYRLGGRVRLSESRRLWVGASYHDETTSWPTLVSSTYNPTFRALFARTDPHDYYRERGLELSAGAKLLDQTRLELRYADALQLTQDTVPGIALGSGRWPALPNPPIGAGRMRALAVTLTWDSRAMMRSGGSDYRLGSRSWTRASLGVEVAEPSLIPDDFTYRRWTLDVVREQQSLLGSTAIVLAAGLATGDAPPQRYFTVDFGMGVLAADGVGFRTLYRTNYSGNRAVMLAGRHDFDRPLLAFTAVPVLRSITMSLHGGVFWTDFVDHTAQAADTLLATAPTPYSEVGFSLGNLTPFLSPINFSASFTWQLSSYPTRNFRFGFGFTGP